MATSRVIAVIGSKGGCGTTTLTANLAATWTHPGAAAAIDLDCGRGDLAGLLDLAPRATLPGVLSPETDEVLLRGSAVAHRCGLYVVGQPDDLSRLVRPTPAEILHLLGLCRQVWELTLLDCGSRIDEAVVATLRNVDQVIVVSTPDVMSLRNLGRILALLGSLGVPTTQRWVVLNKMPRHPSLPADEIESMLGTPITSVFCEDDPSCMKAIAEGTILREVAPTARLSRQIEEFWPLVNGEPVHTHKWWAPWLGGAA